MLLNSYRFVGIVIYQIDLIPRGTQSSPFIKRISSTMEAIFRIT